MMAGQVTPIFLSERLLISFYYFFVFICLHLLLKFTFIQGKYKKMTSEIVRFVFIIEILYK